MNNSLPSAWVEKLFGRLAGIYGTGFTNKFSNGALDRATGKDLGLENAKQVWAEELAGFASMPEAIGKALQDIDPKFAPSSREFVMLCRDAARTIKNDKKAIAYTPTSEDLERAKKWAEKAAAASRKAGKEDQKGWARDLRKSYLAGEKLTVIQQQFASEALGEVWMNGVCTPNQAAA
jgi:hypothetical protein